jgi:hypothetical protein
MLGWSGYVCLERGLDEMVEQEKALISRGPGQDTDTWLKKLAKLETQEERLLDLCMESRLEVDRYEKRRPTEVVPKDYRGTPRAYQEPRCPRRVSGARPGCPSKPLLALRRRPLGGLKPEGRNRIYKMLDLTVLAHGNGNLEVKWALGGDLCRDNEPLLRRSSASTTDALKFRTVLIGDGSEKVGLAKVHERWGAARTLLKVIRSHGYSNS